MEGVTLLLSGLLFFALVWLVFWRSSKRAQFVSMVDMIPGPQSYPIIGSMGPFLFIKRNQIAKSYQKYIQDYGPFFRTWLGPLAEVNIMLPEHMEVILTSSKHLDKASVYSFLHEWLGTGLLTSTGQKWHSHRKMITPTFHFKILDSFMEVFSENSEILVNKLRKEVGGRGFDVYPYITKCALDIICETAMGTSIYAQDDCNTEYVTAVYDVSELTLKRMRTPWLHPQFIFKLTGSGRRYDECLKVLHGFTNKVIKERQAQRKFNAQALHAISSSEDEGLGKKKRKAFLDLLLEASLDGVKLTDEELREEVDTFMFEGHDTTSAGMCWALYLLGLHQDIQEKAYEEQCKIFQGSERSCTMKDLSEMKYLERVIKESLRLCPSVPVVARVLKEDLKLDGYTIPAGCMATLHLYNLHRDPQHFPNPENFDPDNFLSDKVAKRHPYAYLPFSAGPRNCIGQKFAILEEKTVLSYILRNYKMTSLEKREDINVIAELVMRPENGIKLCITPRRENK